MGKNMTQATTQNGDKCCKFKYKKETVKDSHMKRW